MILIKELTILRHISEIPSVIQIVASNIWNIDEWTVGLQHEDMCHCSQSCLVHFMGKVIQHPMILHQIFISTSACGDLI